MEALPTRFEKVIGCLEYLETMLIALFVPPNNTNNTSALFLDISQNASIKYSTPSLWAYDPA